jgi:drug/metabolite transporter (DMT)-like permease
MSLSPEQDSGTSPAATAAAIGALGLWCWSGPCFAAGSRAMGAMPYLTCIALTGSLTGAVLHRARRQSLRDLLRLPRGMAIAGFFGIAVYTLILAFAVGIAPDSDIGQVVLINYLWPIWLIVLGIALLDVKPRIGLTLAAAALGFGGVLVARGTDTFTQAPSNLLPHALSFVGAFLWALYSVLLKRWKVPEENGGSTLQFFLCGIMAAVAASLNGQWAGMPPLTGEAIFWILFGGIGPVGLAYYWWEIGIKRGSVHLIALLAFFVPIISAVLVGLLFREAMSPGLIPGAIMIAAAAFLGRRATQGE